MTRLRDFLGGGVSPWSLVLLAAAACLSTAAPTKAAYYCVFGRVYGAVELSPGEGLVNAHPLVGKPAAEIIGGDAYTPTSTLSMVVVKILDGAGNELASDLARIDGAYYMTFSHAAASLSVEFEVRDAEANDLFLRTAPVPLSAGSSRRYLLVPQVGWTVAGGIPFPPGGSTGLFTRVGFVEFDDIYPAGVDRAGLAKFSGDAKQYRDAPFGGRLQLFGAVSQAYYPSPFNGMQDNYYYRIRIEDANGSISYMSDDLWKRKYVVDMAAGTVTSTGERLGPAVRLGPSGSVPNCYKLTPIAEGPNIFWSYPDLLADWSTGNRNGIHTLTLELWYSGGTEVSSFAPADPLTLWLDNTPVQVSFNKIERDLGDGSPENLLDPSHSCDIISLATTGGVSPKLTIDFTAHHANGYLSYYYLRATANSGVVVPWTKDQGTYYVYDPNHPAADHLTGTVTTGVSVAKDAATFTGPACAYIFDLRAVARTTNGYHRINGEHQRETYYVYMEP